MQRLLAFIFRYRIFFVFMGLEAFCFWLIFSENDYQRVVFLNSTNSVVGSVSQQRAKVKNYFSLKEQNNELVSQNAHLKELLIKNSAQFGFSSEEIKNIRHDNYRLYPAKVVNNSVHLQNNYITLNIGTQQGLEPGMGVISEQGVIGSILSCSNNYSLVASVLHSQTMISSKIKRTGTLGTIRWGGKNTKGFKLNFIPRHVKLNKGDTVITSGYNAIYPEGQIIGTIKDFDLEANSSFYDIDVQLFNDLSGINYVYVVENIDKTEQKNLEATVND